MATGNVALRALAFVLFIAMLVGASWGVGALLGDQVSAQAVKAEPLRATLNATAGHAVTFPVKLNNRGTEARDLVATATAFGQTARSAAVTTPAGASKTVFLTLQVPDGLAPGDHPVNLTLENATGGRLRESAGALTVRVLPAGGAAFDLNRQARVVYTLRSADTGTVYESNDPALAGQDFARVSGFSGVAPAPLLAPRDVPFQGFLDALVGALPGETRSVTFGPESGAGNATFETREPRLITLNRTQTLDLPVRDITADRFSQFLEANGLGNYSDYHAGSVFNATTQTGETVAYRVQTIDQTRLTYVPVVNVGETYTVYPYFPDASRVLNVTDTDVTFYTTPAEKEGDNMTALPYWPSASRLVTLNDTAIVIRHDPRVGLQFAKTSNDPTAPAVTYTVKALTDDEVIETTQNPDPLAGKSITVDFTVLSVS